MTRIFQKVFGAMKVRWGAEAPARSSRGHRPCDWYADLAMSGRLGAIDPEILSRVI